jgi:hypothetical protein
MKKFVMLLILSAMVLTSAMADRTFRYTIKPSNNQWKVHPSDDFKAFYMKEGDIHNGVTTGCALTVYSINDYRYDDIDTIIDTEYEFEYEMREDCTTYGRYLNGFLTRYKDINGKYRLLSKQCYIIGKDVYIITFTYGYTVGAGSLENFKKVISEIYLVSEF